eukprot:jgi/Mesvir1/20499/Mv12385-RA.1
MAAADCPTCFEPFGELRPPRSLPGCGHALCNTCLDDLITKNTLGAPRAGGAQCPVCFAWSELSDDVVQQGAEALPVHVDVAEAADARDRLEKEPEVGLKIERATYGAFDKQVDVTEKLQAMVDTVTHTITLPAGMSLNALFGDVAKFHEKELRVDFRIAGGDVQRVIFTEKQNGETRVIGAVLGPMEEAEPPTVYADIPI